MFIYLGCLQDISGFIKKTSTRLSFLAKAIIRVMWVITHLLIFSLTLQSFLCEIIGRSLMTHRWWWL